MTNGGKVRTTANRGCQSNVRFGLGPVNRSKQSDVCTDEGFSTRASACGIDWD